MLTRIEIDGFKTFQNFSLELAPFQVIIGTNGSGKSNLFDALRLMAHLAESDLRTAFQAVRGEAGELFTILPDGTTVPEMRLAVELMVDRQIQDSWGAEETLKYTRLRYELHIARRTDPRGLERLYVTHESLRAISREKDGWLRRHIGKNAKNWLPKLKRGRQAPFISTSEEEGKRTIYLHQDGHGGRKASVAEKAERTILSGVNNVEFPHAFAAREEMRSWRLLQLNPEVLRQPSSMLAPPVIAPDGSNLPSALARMQAQDPYVLNDVSRDLANLVPGIVKVEIEHDEPRSRYVVWAYTPDGRRFSSRVLSDGTLRLLALVALKHDPQHRGLLCFEEPENGVHPFRLRNMVDLLRSLTTDFSKSPHETEEPLRQLLVNTHSPILARALDVERELLFAYISTRVQSDKRLGPFRVTRIVPVKPGPQLSIDLGIDEKEQAYTLGEVITYLESADSGEVRA